METRSGYLERILKARVYDVAVETPLDAAPRLSARLGNHVLLKREDLQPVFSFKLRGAHNKLAQLARGGARARRHLQLRGQSRAGRGALGAAFRRAGGGRDAGHDARRSRSMPCARSAPRSCCTATPTTTPMRRRARLADGRKLAFVHPFDDPAVIAGQGTIAMEILRQHRGRIDAIFVPVGGGGLASGIALYVKALYPEIRVIGVEAEESPSMQRSLAAGAPVTLEHVGIFADGVAVRRVGDETFRICKELLDDMILVSTDEICAAIQDIFEDTRSIMEPAGALAVAGLKRHVAGTDARGQTLVAINSGANVNFDRLRHIAERAAVGEEREALFAVEIPEAPGSFLRFCQTIGQRSVTEFNYRFGDTDPRPHLRRAGTARRRARSGPRSSRSSRGPAIRSST